MKLHVGVVEVPVPDNVAHDAEVVNIAIVDGITIFILPLLDIGSIVVIWNVYVVFAFTVVEAMEETVPVNVLDRAVT